MKALKLSLFLAGIAVLASGISTEPAEAHIAAAADGEVQSVWDVTEDDGQDVLFIDVGKSDILTNTDHPSQQLYLYTYDSTSDAKNANWPGVAMTRIGETGRWYASFDEGIYNRAIINGGNDTRQTTDISLEVYKDYDFDSEYRVVTTLSDWHGDWGTGQGVPGQYDYYTTAESAHEYGPDYFRFFLDRGAAGQTGYETYIAYTVGDKKILSLAAAYPQANDSTWLAQYELPTEAIGGSFKVVTANNKLWMTDESEWKSLTIDQIHGLQRVTWNTASDNGSTWPTTIASLEKATLHEYEVSNTFVGTSVISGLFTCLPSEVNGYLAASEIRANWMTPGDGTWYMYDELSKVTIEDYAVATTGVEDYNEYYQTAEKVPGTNAQAKLDLMLQLEAAHDGVTDASVTALFSEPENVAGITAGTLVLVSILGFSVLYFVRRRKHASN